MDAPGPSTYSEQQKVSTRPLISYGASLRPSPTQISCTGIDFALAAGSDQAELVDANFNESGSESDDALDDNDFSELPQLHQLEEFVIKSQALKNLQTRF
jgi:hypothetical protein